MLICAATNNPGKLKELRRILESQGHTVRSQREMGISVDPDETGATFEENAVIKAAAVCALSGVATVADDSGLAVDALDGAPGVYSARYCGHHGDDEANNDKLLARMEGVPAEKRGAKFVSAVCFMLPGGAHFVCRGECPGRVGNVRKGDNGFGYDPIFETEGFGWRSYAELTDDEKDKISHRGEALERLREQLPAFLEKNGEKRAAAGPGFERSMKKDGEIVHRGPRE